MNTNELIAKIKSDDAQVRTEAWQSAGAVGAPAIRPLAEVVVKGELEVSRAARRAMWQIVRHAGRPGARGERRPVVTALLPLLGADQPEGLRRDAAWMLSEIAGARAVAPVAALLREPALREDARAVLQRLPGEAAVAALKTALAGAGSDFKPSLAHGLRQRGVEVPDVPCHKLKPVKATAVTPEGRA
jgi:HEAT repeat protein